MIRYVVDGYPIKSISEIKNKLRNIVGEVQVGMRRVGISLSFKLENRVLTCEEVDKIVSDAGIVAMRISVARISPIENPNKDKINRLLVILSALSGYGFEKVDEIIDICVRRKGKWVSTWE